MQTNAIFDFIKKNSYLVILIVIIIVLAYGYALGTIDDLSIDEENTFQGSTATHAQNWVGFSRYGLAFTHVVLFPVFDAIPYLNGILSVLFLGASALFLCYYIQQILSPVKPPKIAYAFLCAAVIAYPSNLDYLSFNSINAAVSVGIFLSVLSTYMISRYIFEKQKLGSAIVGVVIAAFVFSIYQAFVGAYLTLIVMYALLYLFSDKFCTQRLKVSFCAQVILKHIAALGASLGLFYAGNYIVRLASGVNNNGYTDGLFQAKSPMQMLINLKYNLQIYFTDFISDGHVIALTVALFILGVILFMFKKTAKNRLLIGLLSLALILAPFTLGIIWAGVSPRVLLAIPMMVGFCGFLAIMLFFNMLEKPLNQKVRLKKASVIFVTLLVVVASYTFIYYDNLSSYASHVRYVRDESFAQVLGAKIIDEIQTDAPDAPVVLVGNYEIKEMENGNDIGYAGSLFNYDNTHFRGVFLMNYLGFKFTYATREELARAEVIAANMPVWPEAGSIKQQDGLIIVRLSEDY